MGGRDAPPLSRAQTRAGRAVACVRRAALARARTRAGWLWRGGARGRSLELWRTRAGNVARATPPARPSSDVRGRAAAGATRGRSLSLEGGRAPAGAGLGRARERLSGVRRRKRASRRSVRPPWRASRSGTGGRPPRNVEPSVWGTRVTPIDFSQTLVAPQTPTRTVTRACDARSLLLWPALKAGARLHRARGSCVPSGALAKCEAGGTAPRCPGLRRAAPASSRGLCLLRPSHGRGGGSLAARGARPSALQSRASDTPSASSRRALTARPRALLRRGRLGDERRPPSARGRARVLVLDRRAHLRARKGRAHGPPRRALPLRLARRGLLARL